METFPDTVLCSFPLVTKQEFKTLITPFESGKEQRRKAWAFPKRHVALNHTCVKLTELDTLWGFYTKREGSYDPFWFVFPVIGGSKPKWTNELLGRGNKSQAIFDLRSKDTDKPSVVVYVNGVQSSFSFIQGEGQAGGDRIELGTAPDDGAIVTADFKGRLILKARFADDSAPRGCTKDEGRPLGAGLQGQASNHLKLLWLNAMVVSVKEKARRNRVR